MSSEHVNLDSQAQSHEKVTVTRSLTEGNSTKTKENLMLHLKHAYFSLFNEEGFQLGVFLPGGKLNIFLDSGQAVCKAVGLSQINRQHI